MLGLVVGTFMGGLATDLPTLVLARVVAGIFGGPATSPGAVDRGRHHPCGAARQGHGRGDGRLLGGVGAGRPGGPGAGPLGTWRTPFWGVAALIAIAAIAALRLLPPLRAHLERATADPSPVSSLVAIVKKPVVALSLAMTALTMTSVFIVIPNIPAFVQFNLGFQHLDLLYLLGGVMSFATTRVVGPQVDRFGSTRVAFAASALVVVIVYMWFVAEVSAVPVLVVSTLFFLAMSARGVSYNTLTSKVPEPHERARFQSVQSAVQHAASAAAAFASAQLLSEGPDHRLLHVARAGIVSIVLVAFVPVLMTLVERQVRRRGSTTDRPPPAEPAA
jgi:predicted MFS family arabinose efflux permease